MTYLTKEDWEKNYVQKICDDKSFSEYFQEKKKIYSDFIFLIQKIFKNQFNNNTSPKKIIQRILYSSFYCIYLRMVYRIPNTGCRKSFTIFILKSAGTT